MKLPEACPNCERLARCIAQQDAEIATLKAQLAQALARITQLEQQLAVACKDSSTSSKPPSSDIIKPKPLPKGGKKRKKGGQPGHNQHLRSLFPPEAVDHFEPHTLDCCPDCGGWHEAIADGNCGRRLCGRKRRRNDGGSQQGPRKKSAMFTQLAFS
jgi:hypothetical protein